MSLDINAPLTSQFPNKFVQINLLALNNLGSEIGYSVVDTMPSYTRIYAVIFSYPCALFLR